MRVAGLLSVAMWLLFSNCAAFGQISVGVFRADTVAIEVHGQDGSTEMAAGMYVGHDDTKAYFITAAHIILKDKATKVRILYFNTASWVDASIFGRNDPDRDLEVITAPVGTLPGGIRRTTSKNPVVSTPFSMIGHPAAGDWQTFTGSIQNDLSADGKSEWFTGSGGASLGGYSGGPAFDPNGHFLGIHLSGAADYTRNLRSLAIIQELSTWGVPYENISEDTDARRFRICTEMIDALRQDDAETARANFSTQAKNLISNSQLIGNWNIDMGVLGEFKSDGSQSKRGVAGTMLYATSINYARGKFDVRVQFDSNDQIINFWLATLSGADSSHLEQAAAAAVQRLGDGQFTEAYNNVPESLRFFTSPDMLRNLWVGWESTAGQFVKVESAQKLVDFDLVAVRCKFATKEVIIQVQFAPSLQVMSYNAFPVN